MLIQKIVDLLPEIAQLSSQDQETIAEDIYADLVDAKFRRNLENGEPMPAFEAAVREAKEQAARGETMSLDEWLADETYMRHQGSYLFAGPAWANVLFAIYKQY